MAQQEWFVVRGGVEEGPFTGTQLKDMARSGKLRPTDLVRRGDVESARPASAVKGLFPADGGAPPAPTPKQSVDPPTGAVTASKKRLVVVGAVAGLLVLLCGGVGVITMLFNKEQALAQQELAEADKLWTSGDKAGAAAKYRTLIQNRSRRNTVKDRLAPAYGRLIDFECEAGNTEAAKTLFAEAADVKVTPAVNHPDAKTLLAAFQTTQQPGGSPTSRATKDVLSADYYPFPSGTSRQNLGRLYFKDNLSAQYRKEYTYRSGGEISVRWMTMYGPNSTALPLPKPYKLMHRIKDGFVEVGEENDGLKQTVWHPVVKVGAKVGDEWEREVIPGMRETYKLTGFGVPKRGNKEIDFDGGGRKGKVVAAFIEVRIVTDLGGGKSLVTSEEYELGPGVGVVSRSAFEGEGQGRKMNWSEFLTRPVKD